MKRTSRKSSNLSESLQRHLNAYTLAATAAGVGMLALGFPTEAEIIYAPAHKDIGPGHRFRLDVNHDGTVDFSLSNVATCGTDLCRNVLFQKPVAGNSAVGYIWDSSRLLASALNRGARVGAGAAEC